MARIQLDRAEGKERRATVTAWRFFNAEGQFIERTQPFVRKNQLLTKVGWSSGRRRKKK